MEPKEKEHKMNENTAALVAHVKAHATEHYNRNGWDFVVEAMDDEEIASHIGNTKSEKVARARVRRVARALDDARREVAATAF